MYNIHSHYENIFHYLETIVTYPRMVYLLPYGSTQPENLERLECNIGHTDNYVDGGPLFIFYDQEPLLTPYNYDLFDYIQNNYQPPFVLVTTEKDSVALNNIKQRYNWPTAYNFHHIFAAQDWFRGYSFDRRLISPEKRTIKKKYITFNRLTSNLRVYRTVLIGQLQEKDLLNDGYVSYHQECPDGSNYQTNLENAVKNTLISEKQSQKTIKLINDIKSQLRIDFTDQQFVPNQSFVLSAINETQESFCYLVTETCFWEQKKHLTEKIFKPIVSRMPFILVGAAHNLKYLKEYGFKTFDRWIDETYDSIEDPIERLDAVTDSLKKICSYSNNELKDILIEMSPVIEHNYELFYSKKFLDNAWEELTNNLKSSIKEL